MPISAGRTKLIIHKEKVADKIPIELFDNKPNKYKATEPYAYFSYGNCRITETTNSIVVIRIIELM